MSALIIDLAEARAVRKERGDDRHVESRAQERFASAQPLPGEERFHFWSGASGQRYVHTVYSLIECPPLPASNYVLVKRNADSHRAVLAIGRVRHDASSLNLAEIRRRGAQLGANEVHVHLLATTAKEARLVQHDLQSGHLNDTWTEARQASMQN